jgi:DNA topoisomerase-3
MRLVLCEKPSQAKSIAAVLGANKRDTGFFEGEGYIISWCFGHLVEPAQADAYGENLKRWSLATLPILPGKWKYEASKGKAKQLAVLKTLMNRADVDTVICATDAGREGELIFRLVYDYCKCKKDGARLPPIQRLWISSMEDKAIRDGFAGLKSGAEYDNLYRSALCRANADWLVGINATRLFSCLYDTTLSVGRVQSPTLALIVGREKAVSGFMPEPFYTPVISCNDFTAAGERQSDAAAAETIRAAADGADAVCLSIARENKTVLPPKLYDLTTLQREANRLFGFTAQQTLDYAQSLYEKKLITYPRTDSRYLNSCMEEGVIGLVRAFAVLVPYANKNERLISAACVIKDSAITDHHAIIPTLESVKADISTLPAGEQNVLNMIITRLLCSLAPAHRYEAVTAVIETGGNNFTAKGKTITLDGWKAIESGFRATLKTKPEEESEEEESVLPELAEGQIFKSVTATINEGRTSAPRRYTEDTLLSALENATDAPDGAERKGLGTPATRAAIIEKLIKSGFIERSKKNLVPTEKGINLIAILPDTLKSPLLTADWEQRLTLVESGELSEAEFMDGITAMLRELVKTHTAPLPEYMGLFAPSSGRVTDAIAVCPRCNSGVVEHNTGFFCSSRNCKFGLWKDNRFFAAKRKKLTKDIAITLLKEGRVHFSDLYSEKTGKTYSATVILDDTGDRVNFKLDFEGGGSK